MGQLFNFALSLRLFAVILKIQCSPANPDMRWSGQRGTPDSGFRVNIGNTGTTSGLGDTRAYPEPVIYFRFW